MLKTIIFSVIVLVIPLFFGFIFVNSRRNRLSALRAHHRTAATRLAEEFAARRILIRQVAEALLAVMAKEPLSVKALRAACEAAESAAGGMNMHAENMTPNLIGSAETALDEAMTKCVAIAQSSAEVRASAACGDLLDRLASANLRVGAARQAWEEAEAALRTGLFSSAKMSAD